MTETYEDVYENELVDLPDFPVTPSHSIQARTNETPVHTVKAPEAPVSMSCENDNKYYAEPSSQNKVLTIVLVVIVVLLLCGAVIMSALALAKYSDLDNRIANVDVPDEREPVESSTAGTDDEPETRYNSCTDEPCRNGGKCVTIIQGGYYCICPSDKFYGRHCENALDDERPVLFPHNCKNIKQSDPEAKSGVYLIQILDTDRIFPVYCDQETDGGGWTLVWRYGFTNYEAFSDASNAVTPVPYWNVVSSVHFVTDVEASTSPPLGEDEKGAVDFALWKEIGSDFMVKSNINNWIKCRSSSPTGGSLVTMRTGAIQCEMVKVIHNCTATTTRGLPNLIRLVSNAGGPDLSTTHRTSPGRASYYYFYKWDGSTTAESPTHDPCGASGQNQKQNVADPYGAVYLR